MNIKEFALHTQRHIESAAATTFKRSHVYELMAAAFGYRTYAALCSEAVFHRRPRPSAPETYNLLGVASRCSDLGYASAADKVTTNFWRRSPPNDSAWSELPTSSRNSARRMTMLTGTCRLLSKTPNRTLPPPTRLTTTLILIRMSRRTF